MTGETKRRADAYLTGGYGGLVGFEIGGGARPGARFIDALKMFYHVANIGDCAQPGDPSGLHDALAAVARGAARDRRHRGYVRLSVGIEHIDDILADLDQALAAV